ncbi:MAG TPA: hypothetical protein VJ111_00790 [Chitinophagaceae bacterium]|nr:hypothetical protein [Chitinophagaceae bacterium]
MKIIFLGSLMIAFSLIHQKSAFAQTDYVAKVTMQQEYHSAITVATVLNFKGIINNNRVLLNWTLDKNQVVDQIEVERSGDEKTFVMAGLVFGTDKPDKAEYLFYEKNRKTKLFYRLRIINKDRTVIYSSVISPEPASPSH